MTEHTTLSVAAVQAVCSEMAEPSVVRRAAMRTDANMQFVTSVGEMNRLRDYLDWAREQEWEEVRVCAGHRSNRPCRQWVVFSLASEKDGGDGDDDAEAPPPSGVTAFPPRPDTVDAA
jgi:hypothetical protein